MHFIRLFLAAWLELGIVTVFFLYWLCKQTARRINTSDKPVLDQDTFQRLLAAAFSLQEQNRHPVMETKAASAQTVSLPLESVPMARSYVEPLASLNDSGVTNTWNSPIPRSDEFFWGIAMAVALAAVFALLLVISLDRISPLPVGLERAQEVPFHKAQPQSSGAAAKTIVIQPEATKTERPILGDKSGRSVAARAHKRIVNPIRHSIYESEADLVAPDTVMRYGRRAAVAP